MADSDARNLESMLATTAEASEVARDLIVECGELIAESHGIIAKSKAIIRETRAGSQQRARDAGQCEPK